MKRTGDTAGFTLLEILVAVTMLGIVLTIVVELFSSSLNLAAVSREYAQATSLGQRKMERVLADKDLFAEEQVSDAGSFDDVFSWDVTVEPFLIHGEEEEDDDLSRVRTYACVVRVRWQSGIHERTLEFRALKTMPKSDIEASQTE